MVIDVPARWTSQEVLKFSEFLALIPESSEYVFDFAFNPWSEPFGMLFVSAIIRRFRQARMQSSFAAKGIYGRGNSYLAHMGFFHSIGVEHGKSPGEAEGNENYLPITTLKYSTIINEAGDQAKEPMSVLEDNARRLARVLARTETGSLVDALTYSLREMMRNVFEHAQVDELNFCAQYWRKSGKVELAVCDSGIGIRKSLARNPHLKIDSDRYALKCAVFPGISGKMFKGVKPRPNDQWQNSGFGLYMLSRLGRHGGRFIVCSGECAMELSLGSPRTYFTGLHQGTAVGLQFDTSTINDLAARLNEFKEIGERTAKLFGISSPPSASKASTLLARDFRGDSD